MHYSWESYSNLFSFVYLSINNMLYVVGLDILDLVFGNNPSLRTL